MVDRKERSTWVGPAHSLNSPTVTKYLPTHLNRNHKTKKSIFLTSKPVAP